MLASPEPAWREVTFSAEWKLDGDFSPWRERGDPKPSGRPQDRLGAGLGARRALTFPFWFFSLSLVLCYGVSSCIPNVNHNHPSASPHSTGT